MEDKTILFEVTKDLFDYTYDGLVVIDKDGMVRMLNRPYGYPGVDQESSIGKHVTEVIENTRMHIVAQTGKEELAQLQKINGNYMIATRVPIIKDGKIVGVVGRVLLKPRRVKFTDKKGSIP